MNCHEVILFRVPLALCIINKQYNIIVVRLQKAISYALINFVLAAKGANLIRDSVGMDP